MAKDAVTAAPNVYRVLFENDKVRLLDVRMRPGDSSPTHSHPDYLVYVLGDGTVTLTSSSGESSAVDLHAGDVMWRDAEEHSAENRGTGEVAAIFFEVK